MDASRYPLSVVVLTRDEQINIRECLAGLEWADDIILVDSGSTDDTVQLARDARGDVRVFTRTFTDFGDQRNWAIDNTQPKHEWILFLDADERCTPECAAAIREAVDDPGENVGFYLACRNIFFGRWLKHCTLYPSWQLRLLKAGHVRYRKEGHGQREVTEGPLGFIHEPYDHYPVSKGITEWLDRHNVYTSNEVELVARLAAEPLRLGDLFSRNPLERRRCLKRMAARTRLRALIQFIYLYFLKRGFLDGREGFFFCVMRAANATFLQAKLIEAKWAPAEATPDRQADSHG